MSIKQKTYAETLAEHPRKELDDYESCIRLAALFDGLTRMFKKEPLPVSTRVLNFIAPPSFK